MLVDLGSGQLSIKDTVLSVFACHRAERQRKCSTRTTEDSHNGRVGEPRAFLRCGPMLSGKEYTIAQIQVAAMYPHSQPDEGRLVAQRI